MMKYLVKIKRFILVMCVCCFVVNPIPAETQSTKPSQACIEVLRSNCDATQDEMLTELLDKLEIHGVDPHPPQHAGNPPAFDALPLDQSGQVNWVRAESIGLILPRGSLTGKEDEATLSDKYYKDLMFFQVKVHIMADVVFPHGMHTNWLSCDSCHPKPFNESRGANQIRMREIVTGKWCGKCHGKVSFTPQDYNNCRRCHVLPKRTFQW